MVVVVPKRVLTELDVKQHEGRAGIKKRARQVLMELREIMRSGTSVAGMIESADQAGVRYWFVPDAAAEPPFTADDVIVATAAALADRADPVVVTSDGAMEMTAQLAGASVHILSTAELDPDEPDPLEAEVVSLKKKVSKLEQPHALKVDVVAAPLWPPGNDVELTRVDPPSDELVDEIRRDVQIRMGGGSATVGTADAVRAYLQQVPAYAQAVATYMVERAQYEAVCEAALYVQVLVVNRTSHPVFDPVLELTAPPYLVFKYPPGLPSRPAAPEPPVDTPASAFPFRGWHMPATSLVGGIKPITGPRVRVEKRWAELRPAEPLRPDHEAYAGKIWIALEPPFPDVDIEIPYVLFAATAGKPVSGVITIPVRHRHEAWSSPPLPRYSSPHIPEISRQTQDYRKFESEH